MHATAKNKVSAFKKGSAQPSFVELKWTFTRSNRYQTMNFFLEFVPMNLFTMEELRLRTVVERGNKATSIKDSIEKTHIHFCKMCLGLNKRSPNVASRNELGRLSLNLQITMNIFKFWIHLENQPPDSIAKLCLNISDKMAEENKSGLINKINLLCTQLNINKQSVNFKNPSAFLSKAENNLSKHLKNHQLNLRRTTKKLKFYI